MSDLDVFTGGGRKSSYSQGNGACVEVAVLPTAMGIRDSKNPDGPRLGMSARQFGGLLTAIKAGGLSPY